MAVVGVVMAQLAAAGCSGVSASESAEGGLNGGFGGSETASGGEGDADADADDGPQADLGPGFGSAGAACDPWRQDCDPGLRCAWVDPSMPELGHEETLEPRCVWASDPAIAAGQPCRVREGRDDCEFGAHCAFVDKDAWGTCLPLCTGAFEQPRCEADTVCLPCPDCPSLCTWSCDPRATDPCPTGMLCAPTSSKGPFLCTRDASPAQGGEHGDACTYANECAAGHDCVGADKLPDCAAERCCAAYCTVNAPLEPGSSDAPCPAGTTCLPWNPSEPPEGLEGLGSCRVPL